MKYSLSLAVLLLTFSASAASAPLKKNLVAADAKWLVHLDLDNFRSTKVGEFVKKRFIEKAGKELQSHIKLDVTPLLEKLSSITAYGTEFEKEPQANSVLLAQMDAEAQKVVEGFIAAQMLADSGGAIKKLQEDPFTLYTYKNEVFLGIQKDHLLLLGKSQKQIDKAREVLAGTAPNLNSSTAFAEFPPVPNVFVFLAVAEGFNAKAEVPPQAQVLKMADGARIVLGEKSEKLFVNLALRAKTSEVIAQIQQVIQGMIALVSLSQTDDKDLQQLIQSTKVTTNKNTVSIDVEFPVASALEKIEAEIEEHHDKAKEKKAKQQSKESQPKADAAPAKEDK